MVSASILAVGGLPQPIANIARSASAKNAEKIVAVVFCIEFHSSGQQTGSLWGESTSSVDDQLENTHRAIGIKCINQGITVIVLSICALTRYAAVKIKVAELREGAIRIRCALRCP